MSQGGSYVEVFSAQGRDPVSKWRLTGTGIRKIFDKDVKSYVYVLEGESATTKMSIPKDEKQSLFLIQKYLILQIMVPLGHSFSFELGVVDMGNNKRRIFLSSSNRELTVTPLHARFPLSMLRLGVWLNLCLDLNSLVGETFKGHTFKSIESLTISANCHLRKMFTMKTQPADTTNDDEIYGCDSPNSGDVEPIPKGMQFTTSPHHTQVCTVLMLLPWKHELILRWNFIEEVYMCIIKSQFGDMPNLATSLQLLTLFSGYYIQYTYPPYRLSLPILYESRVPA